jgi:hypothetical protein
VVTALRELAFPRLELAPRTRPIGCSESWLAFMPRCTQDRCGFAPPIAVGQKHSLYVDASGRLLSCGKRAAVGHGDAHRSHPNPIPVAAMAGVRVRSVAAGVWHSLALGWDGRVHSWGQNRHGQLGHGDTLDRPLVAVIEGLGRVHGIASAAEHSLAVTRSGAVFQWGTSFRSREDELRPIIVEGLPLVRRVCVGRWAAFAIGEDGELF